MKDVPTPWKGIPCPANYAGKTSRNHPEPVVETLQVVHMHKTPATYTDGTHPGIVISNSWDLDDVPGLETISEGVSVVDLGSIAIGRQGRFLLWGFTADPEGMTETGQRLFLNCIRHLHERRTDPWVPFRCHGRARLRFLLDYYQGCVAKKSPITDKALGYFETAVAASDQESLKKLPPDRYGEWLQENLPYLRAVLEGSKGHPGYQPYAVDQDAKALKTPNDRIESLEAWIRTATNGKGEDRERAIRCLDRYTDPAIRPADGGWTKWLAALRGRLRYSDTVGFLFIEWPPSK